MAKLEFTLVVVGNPPLLFSSDEFSDHKTMLAGVEARGYIDCIDQENSRVRIYRHAMQAVVEKPMVVPVRPAIILPNAGRNH